MKISLLGQFGSGNSGNDGSLESMLLTLKALRPDARLLCVCSNPKVIEARFGIAAMSVGGTAFANRLPQFLNRLLMNLPRRLHLLCSALAQFGGGDLLVIPGTGILDDFQEKAFGWPLVIFCWCLAARIRNTKIAFVSIGAGPIDGRLSRWFLLSAGRMASYRSYRDDYSMNYMKSLGIDVSKDHRFPDIAFDLPFPVAETTPPPRTMLSVGVGVMQYRGWRSGDPRAADIYETYVAKISGLVAWLIGEGHRVCLLIGDTTDERARNDILGRLEKSVAAGDRHHIETGSGGSLHEIMQQIATVDITIASRYHNLVCSLKLGRPTISLGYARKNDDLMEDFGQRTYCNHIETFEADELISLVRRLIADRSGAERMIAIANERIRSQLNDQTDLLARHLLCERMPQQMPSLESRIDRP